MLMSTRWAILALLICSSSAISLVAQESKEEKPYLGIIVEQADSSSPVTIIDVDPKGPAAVAGVKPGDQIESINNLAIGKTEDMATALANKSIGASLKFIVLRDGKPVTADVKLAAAPEGAATGGVEVEKKEPTPPGDGPPAPLPSPDGVGPTAPSTPGPARPYLGLTVVPSARGGASISSIRKDSPAARAGFPLGGVIFKVNDLAVENPDDLIDYIASLEPGASIEISYTQNERVFRKQVKLSAIGGASLTEKPVAEDIGAPPPAPTPGGGASRPTTPAPREDRPILNGIGRVLGGGPIVPGAGGGGAPSAQVQIDELRSIIAVLEERIGKLEAELAAMRPGKPEETPAPPPSPAP